MSYGIMSVFKCWVIPSFCSTSPSMGSILQSVSSCLWDDSGSNQDITFFLFHIQQEKGKGSPQAWGIIDQCLSFDWEHWCACVLLHHLPARKRLWAGWLKPRLLSWPSQGTCYCTGSAWLSQTPWSYNWLETRAEVYSVRKDGGRNDTAFDNQQCLMTWCRHEKQHGFDNHTNA